MIKQLSQFLTTIAIWFLGVTLCAQPIKVACVGNSVTYGYGIENREQNSYPAQLQGLLGNDYVVGNFGRSGATLLRNGHRPYMQQPEFEAAMQFHPDVVIISLGLNDTDPRNWPNYRDEFISDYMALIQSFKRSDGTTPEVWIGRLTPIFHTHPRFKSGTRDWFWQIQETIEVVAKNTGARLIDWHTPLYARPDLFPDALHPVKEGATIMANLAYQHLTGDFGGLQPAAIFSDHMVLQRNATIPVWGTANRGEKVRVKLNGKQRSSIAGADGKWRVELPAMAAGGPYALIIEDSSEKLVYKDVMFGEVWLCSGQSNMEFQLQQSANGDKALKQQIPQNIRLLHFKSLAATNNTAWDSTILIGVNNLEYLQGQWAVANKESLPNFSAIAWYFGSELEAELNVPIGLIQMAVGGSPTETWIDRKTIEFNPALVNMLYDWKNNDHIMMWCRERAAINIKQASNKGQHHPYQPAYLYEAGIRRLVGFPIKGVLWYQGESNAHNVELHEVLFPALLDSWRRAWDRPNLPFYFAQLSSLNRPGWPRFRDSQRRLAQQIPHTDMVVTSDVGDETDVHPTQKQPVGERFARLALHQLYGKEERPHGNIKIKNVHSHKGTLRISLDNTKELRTFDGEPLRELQVAGTDGLFHPAKATLKGNAIIIENKEGDISCVRYGWKPYSQGNLINEDGVPMSTFQINYPF
ncbi:sialate O-acetylesterase [Saccharicrinis carchari]|uniref:Sialate O-acetylesterase n=1 Tax=Saccharicrinis carchari TaxID=1168039 RepID=A0A521ENP9_SACCC|nr:GDSL-type esterase/lipase family protein [Saccharicrinis carchari]SMO85538.1 sialate O-acetylesterase [Saccharicrinis carchari]